MKLGWIQNVVIMEAELTMELREWYMKAAKQFGWSKTELITNITASAHDKITLAVNEDANCILEENEIVERDENILLLCNVAQIIHQIKMIRWRLKIKRGRRRRCSTFSDYYRK